MMAPVFLDNLQLVILAKMALVLFIVFITGAVIYLYFMYNPPRLAFSEKKTISSYYIERKAGVSLLSESVVLFILSIGSSKKLYILKKDDDYFYLLTKRSETLLKKTKNINRQEIGRHIYKETYKSY